MVALRGGVTEGRVTAPGDTEVAGGVTALEINQQNQAPLAPKNTTEQLHSASRTGRPSRHPKAITDATYPGMYRVRWPDGRLSDMANLSRINDAIAGFMDRNRTGA
jgi:hypothetical protein